MEKEGARVRGGNGGGGDDDGDVKKGWGLSVCVFV